MRYEKIWCHSWATWDSTLRPHSLFLHEMMKSVSRWTSTSMCFSYYNEQCCHIRHIVWARNYILLWKLTTLISLYRNKILWHVYIHAYPPSPQHTLSLWRKARRDYLLFHIMLLSGSRGLSVLCHSHSRIQADEIMKSHHIQCCQSHW